MLEIGIASRGVLRDGVKSEAFESACFMVFIKIFCEQLAVFCKLTLKMQRIGAKNKFTSCTRNFFFLN